jgi:hypothetical protein
VIILRPVALSCATLCTVANLSLPPDVPRSRGDEGGDGKGDGYGQPGGCIKQAGAFLFSNIANALQCCPLILSGLGIPT